MTNWQPTVSIETLKRRAQLLADVRLFFAERSVLEVETPMLSKAAPTAPYLDSLSTQVFETQTHYLQTSPEFAMKRLLAAGSGDIYQICKVFRDGEQGRHHSPEFTMLEWYRPQLSYHGLMDEVDALLQQVAAQQPAQRFTYQAVFEQYLSINPHTVTDDELNQVVQQNTLALPDGFQTNKDGWLEILMSQIIEPALAKLGVPVIIYDFPASQAQLAKIVQDESGAPVAARFEIYAGGLELANGYDELLNEAELRQRFEQDNRERLKQNKPTMPIDENLLSAMAAGLPNCTGIALGVDRLMMVISGQTDINTVGFIG
jgi:lysyl-tRNA synthetase class 2